MSYRKSIPYLLGVIPVLLAILVPGGPVETRSFSQLPAWVYWGFNAFLIGLGIFTVITLVFAALKRSWASIAAIAAGGLYILVYALDLAGIFPVSADPMPAALLWIEIIDSILAVVLIVFSAKALRQYGPELGFPGQDKGDGKVHHFELAVDNMQESLEIARRAGFSVTMAGSGYGLDGDGHIAYLDTEETSGITVERMERPKRRRVPWKIFPAPEK